VNAVVETEAHFPTRSTIASALWLLTVSTVLLCCVAEALVLARVFILAFAQSGPWAGLALDLSAPLVAPFQRFATGSISGNETALDISTIIAAEAYLVAGLGIGGLYVLCKLLYGIGWAGYHLTRFCTRQLRGRQHAGVTIPEQAPQGHLAHGSDNVLGPTPIQTQDSEA
jgi:uncharacterized protein YggT (Ycf19 family)